MDALKFRFVLFCLLIDCVSYHIYLRSVTAKEGANAEELAEQLDRAPWQWEGAHSAVPAEEHVCNVC